MKQIILRGLGTSCQGDAGLSTMASTTKTWCNDGLTSYLAKLGYLFITTTFIKLDKLGLLWRFLTNLTLNATVSTWSMWPCNLRLLMTILVVWLPSWIAGSYLIREFSRHITAVTAVVDEVEQRLSKLIKITGKSLPSKAHQLRWTMKCMPMICRCAVRISRWNTLIW